MDFCWNVINSVNQQFNDELFLVLQFCNSKLWIETLVDQIATECKSLVAFICSFKLRDCQRFVNMLSSFGKKTFGSPKAMKLISGFHLFGTSSRSHF